MFFLLFSITIFFSSDFSGVRLWGRVYIYRRAGCISVRVHGSFVVSFRGVEFLFFLTVEKSVGRLDGRLGCRWGPSWGLSRWLGCCVREKTVAFSVGGVRGNY